MPPKRSIENCLDSLHILKANHKEFKQQVSKFIDKNSKEDFLSLDQGGLSELAVMIISDSSHRRWFSPPQSHGRQKLSEVDAKKYLTEFLELRQANKLTYHNKKEQEISSPNDETWQYHARPSNSRALASLLHTSSQASARPQTQATKENAGSSLSKPSRSIIDRFALKSNSRRTMQDVSETNSVVSDIQYRDEPELPELTTVISPKTPRHVNRRTSPTVQPSTPPGQDKGKEPERQAIQTWPSGNGPDSAPPPPPIQKRRHEQSVATDGHAETLLERATNKRPRLSPTLHSSTDFSSRQDHPTSSTIEVETYTLPPPPPIRQASLPSPVSAGGTKNTCEPLETDLQRPLTVSSHAHGSTPAMPTSRSDVFANNITVDLTTTNEEPMDLLQVFLKYIRKVEKYSNDKVRRQDGDKKESWRCRANLLKDMQNDINWVLEYIDKGASIADALEEMPRYSMDSP